MNIYGVRNFVFGLTLSVIHKTKIMGEFRITEFRFCILRPSCLQTLVGSEIFITRK